MDNPDKLFEETLRDVYYAEKAILKNLAKMTRKATSEKLRSAFEEHIDQTEELVRRFERIFELMGKALRGERCPAIDGLAEEASEILQEAEDRIVRDAGVLAAAQAVEHYEIARYGTLAAWAEKLGMKDAVKLLETTLKKEKETDMKSSELALSEINIEADSEDTLAEESRGARKKSGSQAAERRA